MMDTIRLTAVITDDHELNVKIPEDIPPGEVELLIQLSPQASTLTANSTREAARAKLAAAGILSTAVRLPPGTTLPTKAQLEAASKLPSGARPSEALISEDRDER